MKIYINNIRIENNKGAILNTRQICELIQIPFENAIVSDEDYNEISPDASILINVKDRFFVVRKTLK